MNDEHFEKTRGEEIRLSEHKSYLPWSPPKLDRNHYPDGILTEETVSEGLEVVSLKTGNKGKISSYNPEHRNGKERGWVVIKWANGRESEGPLQDAHHGAFAQIRIVSVKKNADTP